MSLRNFLKYVVVPLVLGVAVAWLFLVVFPTWLWHPLATRVCRSEFKGFPLTVRDCLSYNFWSGIGSDFGEVTLVGIAVGSILAVWNVYRKLRPHLECHEETCAKLALHKIEGTPLRVCWHHHPLLSQHPHGKVPLHVIHKAHADALVRAAPPAPGV